MLSKGKYRIKGKLACIAAIVLLALIMAWRYLSYGVPHEFLSGEYKGTFEGDYDFTLELVQSLKKWGAFPSWSQTYSGPISVFASNFHVIGQAFLYFFTRDLALSIKFYQIIYFILAGISMFLFANYIYKHRLAALSCAVLYMFAPFFIGEMLSYLHYTTTYFCMPLVYLFTFKALDSDRHIYYGLLSSLIMAFNLLSHPQNMFIAGFFYFLFAAVILCHRVFRMLSHIKERAYKTDFIKAAKVFLLIGLAVFLLSAFYLLPTFLNGYPYTRSLAGEGTWLMPTHKIPDTHTHWHSQSLISAVTLFHWPWFITPLKAMAYPPLAFMFIYSVPFLLVIFGLFFGLEKQNKFQIKIFLFLGIVSLLLSMGTKFGPFSPFVLAYKFIPFFHMARAPYRYFYQGVLTICLLSGLVVCRLPKKASYLLCLAFIIPYLYGASYYANIYNWTLLPSEKPQYFSQVENWLKENNKFGHRVIETSGIPNSLGLGQRMLPNGLDLLLRNINKDYLDKFLSLFGFKYVLAPRQHSLREFTFDKKDYTPPRADDGYEDAEDYEEYYSALTTEFLFVYERLKQDPGFALHSAGTKDVAIFENRAAFANYEIYPARGLMVLGGINAYDFLNLDSFNGYFSKDEPLKTSPVFIGQSKNLRELPKIKDATGELILHNTDLLDLFILLNKGHIIFLSDANVDGSWSFFNQPFGVQQPLPYQDRSLGSFVLGDFSFSDFSVITDRKNNYLNVPIKISKSGNYRVFLRAYGSQDNSILAAYLNNEYLTGLDSRSFRGFRWIELYKGNFKAQDYVLKLEAQEDKPICLDSVFVIADSQLLEGVEDTYRKFEDVFITHIINKQNILRSNTQANTDLYIPKDGRYDFVIRLSLNSTGPVEDKLNLMIDSKDAGSINYALQDIPVNLKLNGIQILKGRHEFMLENLSPRIQLEFISISEPGKAKESPGSAEVRIDYVKNGPDSYKGTIELNQPSLLVLTEANYDGWRARIGRKAATPIITNMFLNGFILNETGKINFNIFYLNFLQHIGTVISFTSLLLIIFYLLSEFVKGKRF